MLGVKSEGKMRPSAMIYTRQRINFLMRHYEKVILPLSLFLTLKHLPHGASGYFCALGEQMTPDSKTSDQ